MTATNGFGSASDGELRHAVMTPEGVPVWFTIARAGDRFVAFLLDTLWIAGALLVVALLGALLSLGGGPWLAAMLTLVVFALRTGYFLWFELRWHGRTPGKRRMQLRVIDANGGVLRPESLVVRNLTREVETFLPIVVLTDPSVIMTVGPDWIRWVAVLWLGVFLFMPLLNRERRRVGDLLGGTMVICEPRIKLHRDVTDTQLGQASEFQFSREQLSVYGIYELHALEELLRDPRTRPKALKLVAQKIQTKIHWDSADDADDHSFLTAFYRAQRARLERDLSLGQARERKQQRPQD